MDAKELRADYADSLRQTLRTTAAAYGYTLSVATTMVALIGTHGTPHTGELFLFVAGGLMGFAALELPLVLADAEDARNEGQVFPFAGALNCLSVPAALGSAVGIAHGVHGELAWLLAPLAATAVYMAVVAVQVEIVRRVRTRTP